MKGKMTRSKFVVLRDLLSRRHIEREDEIDIALAALLASYHVALIGPPGTAKSMLAEDLCNSLVGTKFFDPGLMNKFTVPEEIFGPLNIPLLEQGVYEHIIEDMLPDADIAFLDEAFKANSAILNAMLKIMNERKYKHGRTMIGVPLKTMFVASNELPEGEELGALFDRFQFRKVVEYIRSPAQFMEMLDANSTDELPKITLDELNEAQDEVNDVEVPNHVKETLVEIRADLNMEGIIPSDRRFKQALKALQAQAWLSERDVVTDDDFGILVHMLWNAPQEYKRVARVILDHTNPLDRRAMEILDLADEIAGQYHHAMQEARQKNLNPREVLTKEGLEWFARCKTLADEVKKLAREARRLQKPINRIKQARDRVVQVAQDVGGNTIGMDTLNVDLGG